MKLTKSQRINIISNIAERMQADDYNIIDLTLKQFSLSTSDNWDSDKKSYVMEMVQNATDSDLTELSAHFGIQPKDQHNLSASPSSPTFWEEGKLKVFISHLSSERLQAKKLKKIFSNYGISCFVAHHDVDPTKEWQIEIESALASCDLLIALIHPDFVKSCWCDQEIGYALGRGVPVFTVRCGADPHGFVGRFQAFNGNGKELPKVAEEIFNATLLHKLLQLKMSDILVDLFINSGQFSDAKTRIVYLEKMTHWDKIYVDRLRKAVKNNSQINGSWGVPHQVERLIKKFDN